MKFLEIVKKGATNDQLMYTSLIGVLKISNYSPDGGYLCFFKCAHSGTHKVGDTKQDIHLKDAF